MTKDEWVRDLFDKWWDKPLTAPVKTARVGATLTLPVFEQTTDETRRRDDETTLIDVPVTADRSDDEISRTS